LEVVPETAKSIRPQRKIHNVFPEPGEGDSTDSPDVTPAVEPVYGNMTVPASAELSNRPTEFPRDIMSIAKNAASQLSSAIRANWVPSVVLATGVGIVVVRLLKGRHSASRLPSLTKYAGVATGRLSKPVGMMSDRTRYQVDALGDLARDRMNVLAPPARDQINRWCEQVHGRVQDVGDVAQDRIGEIRDHILAQMTAP